MNTVDVLDEAVQAQRLPDSRIGVVVARPAGRGHAVLAHGVVHLHALIRLGGRDLDDTWDDDEDTTEVLISSLTYARIGWHTTADALLAGTAAARAREQRRTAREKLTNATG